MAQVESLNPGAEARRGEGLWRGAKSPTLLPGSAWRHNNGQINHAV